MVKSVLFVVCSCFILIKGQPVSASCPFTMTPSRVVVEYQGSFSVNCSSTTDKSTGMGWESTLGGVSLQAAKYVLLDIKKVDRWSIESSCYINYEPGPQCDDILPITIYKMPDRVSISTPNNNQRMKEGTEYEIQCDVVNFAPVKDIRVIWYKDEKIMKEPNVKMRISTESAQSSQNQTVTFVLPLIAHKDYNLVKIKCEAKFDFGPTGPNLPPVASSPLELQVLYQPFFEEPEVEMVEVPADGKTRLDCTAKGNPTPEYRWQVPQPTQQKVGREAVVDLQGPFPGTYNCTAFNSQGSSVKQFILTDAPRDHTVLALMVGIPAALGVLLLISGPFIVTRDGTFSLNKGGYRSGQPTSQPI